MTDTQEKVGSHSSDHWGFIFKIDNADKARQAMKMSGLPIFLLGLSTGFTGLLVLLGIYGVKGDAVDIMRGFVWAQFPIGLALIYCGLKIRNVSTLLVPVAAILYTVITLWALTYTIHWSQWIVQILFIILALNGLRGWWWLRQNF